MTNLLESIFMDDQYLLKALNSMINEATFKQQLVDYASRLCETSLVKGKQEQRPAVAG